MPHPKYVWVPDIPYDAGTGAYLIGRLISKIKLEAYLNRIPRSRSMAITNIHQYAGDNKTYLVYVKDENLAPVDLTGATGVMTWKAEKDGSVVIQKNTDNGKPEAEIGAADEGEMYFYLNPVDTNGLEMNRQYVWDVKVQDADGHVFTVLEGVMTLLEPVNLL